ncbi:MAG: DUF3800 domain-containing protein [Candidatus Acidiferrales bacterium]
MAITVYLDESGQESQDHVVVAGFFGNEEQWTTFSEIWRTALGKKKHLHMKELRFKKERDRLLLERLAPIPAQCGLRGIYGSMKASDYSDMTTDKPDDFARGMNAYVLCLMPIFYGLGCELKGHEKIKLVCEAQERYARFAQFAFEYFAAVTHRDPLKPYFSGIEYVSKDSTARTQPADFLSFALAHKFKDPQSVKSRWCKPIFETNDILGKKVSREEIRKTMGNTLMKLRSRGLLRVGE